MSKNIDCLFIGHNGMKFAEYEKHLRAYGVNSGVYRMLELDFFKYKGRACNATDIFNIFAGNGRDPLNPGEVINHAIAYLGTYLDRRGYTFDYVNFFQNEKEDLANMLVKENILTIGIITTFYFSPEPIVEIIEFIRQYNKTAKIIVGGPYIASLVYSNDGTTLAHWFDSIIPADFYVNSSQGEATLVKIIDALKNNLPPGQLNNIYYRSDKGIISTPILLENNKLAENTVNWDLFADRIGCHVGVRTSISCPFSCAFCSFPVHAGKFQSVDVDTIERELNQLDKIGTVKSVYFFDDTFNIPVKRFKKILRMMIKNKYRFKWHSFLRCQFVDKETVELMKEAGCDGVVLGIESGNEEILRNMNKDADVEKYLRGIALLKKYGIIIHTSYIIGFPGETEKSAEDTINFIKESKPDFYAANVWYGNPVTPIYKEKEKYKISGSHYDWKHATMDTQTATHIRNEIFLSIDDSIPIWDYYYGFQVIYHLKNKGMSTEQLKSFLKHFNEGVRQRLTNPLQGEVSDEVITQIKKTLGVDSANDTASGKADKKIFSRIKNEAKEIKVDFDFN